MSNPIVSIHQLNLSTLPPKLRRAYRLIEDEEWEKAAKYFDNILDEEPENGYAYLGKALIEAKVQSPENISQGEIYSICKTKNYARAVKFAEPISPRLIISTFRLSLET